jgi:hypothetical protein
MGPVSGHSANCQVIMRGYSPESRSVYALWLVSMLSVLVSP